MNGLWSPRDYAGRERPRELEVCRREMESSITSIEDSEESVFWAESIPDPCDLDEDVFALAISDLVRDMHLLAVHNHHPMAQAARFVLNLGLLTVTLALQIILLYEVQSFVTAKAVHDIRLAYNSYEIAMYGNDTSRMDVTVNGYYRGQPEFFNGSLFSTLSDSQRLQCCRIPLSQPLFFGIILWIWTTVCLGALLKTAKRMWCLIFRTTTCTSMIHTFSDPTKEATLSDEEKEEDILRVIYQLTPLIKMFFMFLVIIPRFAINVFLLWVGCRWLLATDNFADLILNAVALEFVSELGALIFLAIAPERNRHDLSRTKMLPVSDKMEVSFGQLGQVLGFFVVTISWVSLYMTRFQMVLPDYRWDVHDVCKDWLAIRFKA